MKISVLHKAGVLDWNRALAELPGATIFHRAEWADIGEQVFGFRPHYLLAEDTTGIVGVMPLAAARRRTLGHALVSTPFCVYGGALGADDVVVRALEDHARSLIGDATGTTYLELRRRGAAAPGAFATFERHLPDAAEAVVETIPRKQRAVVRKGLERHRGDYDADGTTFLGLYRDSMRRLGTPVLPDRYFSALTIAFGRSVACYTVRDERGVAGASVLTFRDGDVERPYYAGSSADGRQADAFGALYAGLMQAAVLEGRSRFDFGRSPTDSGPFHYKRHWGFEPDWLDYRIWRAEGEVDYAPPGQGPVSRAARSLWSRLPTPVATRLSGLAATATV